MKTRSTKTYCPNCDGVGWNEGGECLQTTCHRCDGTGILKTTYWVDRSKILRQQEKPFYPKKKAKRGK